MQQHRILAYEIPFGKKYFSLELYEKAKPLAVIQEKNTVRLTVLQDIDQKRKTRNFRVVEVGMGDLI